MRESLSLIFAGILLVTALIALLNYIGKVLGWWDDDSDDDDDDGDGNTHEPLPFMV